MKSFNAIQNLKQVDEMLPTEMQFVWHPIADLF